jgi:hypothetical protein
VSQESRLVRLDGEREQKRVGGSCSDIEDAEYEEIGVDGGCGHGHKHSGIIGSWWYASSRDAKVGLLAAAIVALAAIAFSPGEGSQSGGSQASAGVQSSKLSSPPVNDAVAPSTKGVPVADSESEELAALAGAFTGDATARKFVVSNDRQVEDGLPLCSEQGATVLWFFGWFNSDHPNSFAMVADGGVSLAGRFHFNGRALSFYDVYETDADGAPHKPFDAQLPDMKVMSFKGGAFLGEGRIGECNYDPEASRAARESN